MVFRGGLGSVPQQNGFGPGQVPAPAPVPMMPMMPREILSVYVKHPKGIEDQWIEQLLRLMGPLFKWKPTIDPSTQKSKGFGFADYSDMPSLAKAMRLLNNLPLPDFEARDLKPMILKLDKATTQKWEMYKEANPMEHIADEETQRMIQAHLQELPRADFSGAAKENPIQVSAPSIETKPVSKSNHYESKNNELSSKFVKAAPEEPMDVDDEQEELRRIRDRKRQDQERAYLEQFEKWESREAFRLKLRREHLDQEQQREHARKEMLQFLKEYDDDIAEKENKDLWFRDRDQWIKDREKIRSKEIKLDAEDRQREMNMIRDREEAEKRRRDRERAFERQKEESRRKEEERRLRKMEDSRPDVLSATELKKKLHEKLKTDLKFLHPISGINMHQELLEYPIDWTLVPFTLIEKRIAPLVGAKIRQFLGEDEPNLVDFILETVLPSEKAQNENGELMFTSQQRDIHEVSEEIEVAFGDSDEDKEEARSLMREILRTVIWFVERSRIIEDREVHGLEKPVDELEIEEIM